MRRLVSTFILVIILMGTPAVKAVGPEPTRNRSEMPALAAATPRVKALYSDAVRSFALYSSYLGDCRGNGYYMIPWHGPNRTAALNYLQQGFTAEMAEAIIDECTVFNNDLGCLVINPGDGIPVLNNDDAASIQVYHEDGKCITFLRKYYNCYAEGDQYIFLVTLTLTDKTWKISDISFTAIE